MAAWTSWLYRRRLIARVCSGDAIGDRERHRRFVGFWETVVRDRIIATNLNSRDMDRSILDERTILSLPSMVFDEDVEHEDLGNAISCTRYHAYCAQRSQI
jgi:hypothetical protein